MSIPQTSPFVSPNANKPIDNINYTKTYPTTERVAGIAVETGLAIGAEKSGLGTTATLLGLGTLEACNVRGKTEEIVRKFTADKTITYTDKSKDLFVDDTRTSLSPTGDMIAKTQIRNGSHIHTHYQNGKPHTTTYYPAQGGIYTVGPNGKFQDHNGCTIL